MQNWWWSRDQTITSSLSRKASKRFFFWKTWTTCPAFINKEKRVYKAPETPKSASFRDSSLGGPKGKGTTHVLWGQLVRCLAPANTQSLKSSFRRAINLDTGTSSCLKTLLLRSFHRDHTVTSRCKHHFYIHYCLNKIGIKRIISMKHWYQNTGTHAWFERALRIKSWLPFSWSLHYYRLANPLEKLWRDNLHDQTSLTKCKFTTSTYIYN